MNTKTIYGVLGILLTLVIAGGAYVATRPAKTTPPAQTTPLVTGGQPVADTAGAAMAYAFNLAQTGNTIQRLTSCKGSGPLYSCFALIAPTGSTSTVCGKITFSLTRAGLLKLLSGVQVAPAKCGTA